MYPVCGDYFLDLERPSSVCWKFPAVLLIFPYDLLIYVTLEQITLHIKPVPYDA